MTPKSDVTARLRAAEAKADAPKPKQTGLLHSLVMSPIYLARSLHPNRAQSPVAMLAFYATLAGMAVAEIVEPPVILLIAAAHALASSRLAAGKAIGEAISEVT